MAALGDIDCETNVSDTVTVTATDTVYADPGVSRVDFTLSFDAGAVEGHTLTPPPRASGILTLHPIPITVVTSELPDGSWQTDVTLPPPFVTTHVNCAPESASIVAGVV